MSSARRLPPGCSTRVSSKGDRIAIMLPNTLQYPIALFGALRAGLVVVNTNPLYTAPELEHQLADSGATAILVLENFAHVVQKVLPRTKVRHVLVTAAGEFLPVSQVPDRQLCRAPRAQAGAGLEHSRSACVSRPRSRRDASFRWRRSRSIQRTWPSCSTPAARRVSPRAPCSRTAMSAPTCCRPAAWIGKAFRRAQASSSPRYRCITSSRCPGIAWCSRASAGRTS